MNNETYPLDEITIGMVTELREQQKNAQIALNALLTYFARINKLDGPWELAQNGRELVPPRGFPYPPPQSAADAGKPNGAEAASKEVL